MGLNLKSFSDSVLSPGMPNCASYVLFIIFCAGNIFKHGNPIVRNKYITGEINKTLIVIITILSTYLFKWTIATPNNYPVLV